MKLSLDESAVLYNEGIDKFLKTPRKHDRKRGRSRLLPATVMLVNGLYG